MTPQWKRLTSVCTFTAVCALAVNSLSGAGFILMEQSISGLGVGFASGAAGLDDNSSMYFNPATLSLVEDQQITGGVHFIMPKAKFNNEGSLTAFNGVSGVPVQGPNDDGGKTAIVPNIYYSRPLSEDLTIGVCMTTPYGLATKYKEGWVGRYIALESDLMTVNTNVALAYEISDTVTIGGGLSVCYADAILSNAINFGSALLATVPAELIPPSLMGDVAGNLGGTKYDGFAELTGDDIGYGFNFGVLFTPDESTRIGFHYRSNVRLRLSGDAKFMVPGALDPYFGSIFTDQGGSVGLNLPDMAQLSFHRYITPEWAIMADIFHTWWQKFETLNIEFSNPGTPNSVIPELWENVWRLSVGTTYDLNEEIQLRAGIVNDWSPVPNASYRSPRIPDEDRFWLSIGIGWKISETMSLDAAFVHILVDDPVIDNPTHSAGEYLIGTMDASVSIFSVGGNIRF